MNKYLNDQILISYKLYMNLALTDLNKASFQSKIKTKLFRFDLILKKDIVQFNF